MSLALVRLLQLTSPSLPVGAFAYSQGLECAIDDGIVTDESSAGEWISDLLVHTLGSFDGPILAAMMNAWSEGSEGDELTLRHLEERIVASRESAELRAETLQMGYSLRRLLDELNDFAAPAREQLHSYAQISYPLAWSCAAAEWQVPVDAALTAYLWGFAENQVMAALKAVPLGQAAGQRILAKLGTNIPAIVVKALNLSDDDYSNFAPGFAIACCRHETQYSRLFRS